MKPMPRSILAIAVCTIAVWCIFISRDNSKDKTGPPTSATQPKVSASFQHKTESGVMAANNSPNESVESDKHAETQEKIIQRFCAALRNEEFKRAKLISKTEGPNGDVSISYRIELPTAVQLKEQDEAMDIALKASGGRDSRKLNKLQLKLKMLMDDFRPSAPWTVRFSVPADSSELITVIRFESEEPMGGANASESFTLKNVEMMRVNRIDEHSRYSAYLTTE